MLNVGSFVKSQISTFIRIKLTIYILFDLKANVDMLDDLKKIEDIQNC